MKPSKPLNEQDSLRIINEMMHKGRKSVHETGSLAILWGLVIIFCSMVTWANVKGYWNAWPFNVWLLTLLAIVPSVIISYQEKKRQPVRHYEDDVLNYVWICFGVSLGLISFLNGSVNNALQTWAVQHSASKLLPAFNEISIGYYLLLYGLPTFITGMTKKFLPMIVGGLFCWGATVVVVFTPVDVDLLIMATAALVSWFIPGLILRNRKLRNQMQTVGHV